MILFNLTNTSGCFNDWKLHGGDLIFRLWFDTVALVWLFTGLARMRQQTDILVTFSPILLINCYIFSPPALFLFLKSVHCKATYFGCGTPKRPFPKWAKYFFPSALLSPGLWKRKAKKLLPWHKNKYVLANTIVKKGWGNDWKFSVCKSWNKRRFQVKSN